jgi:hypothetical protein
MFVNSTILLDINFGFLYDANNLSRTDILILMNGIVFREDDVTASRVGGSRYGNHGRIAPRK